MPKDKMKKSGRVTLRRLVSEYRVERPKKFRLSQIDPGDTATFERCKLNHC